MGPNPGRRREFLQEQGGGDRPGLGPAGGIVAQVSDLRLQRRAIAGPQRHAPQRIPDGAGGLQQVGGQGLVVGVERRQLGPEGDAGRAGQGGEVERQIGRMLPGAGQDVGQDQPALGVGVADLDGQALAAVQDVARPEGVGGDGVLDRRHQHHQPHGQAGLHDQTTEGERMGRAAHVLLHVAHPGGGLDVQSAGIEHHPFADQGHQRKIGAVEVPADLDDPGRAVGGGGAADGVDGGVVLLQQGVASDHGRRRPGGRGDLAGDGFNLQRAHVGGRGVDHLSGESTGRGDTQGRVDIHALRRDQPHPVAVGFGLVAVEDIGPEQEGQGRRARILRLSL